MAENTKRLSCDIPKALWKELREIKDEENISTKELVTEALQSYVQKYKEDNSVENQ